MTMQEKTCDVCRKNQPIGVASTVMPYSCAYCVECARRMAQPLEVFECLYDDATNGVELADWVFELETFLDGRYMTYREYVELKHAPAN